MGGLTPGGERTVAKKTLKKVKHVPQRTCVGCRSVLAKRNLIRLVRTPEGVQVDLKGKMAGRGAYLHDQRSCWHRALKGPLANALKVELSQTERAALLAFLETLPESDDDPLSGPSSAESPGSMTP